MLFRSPAVSRYLYNRFDRFDLNEEWFFTRIVRLIKPDSTVLARRFHSIELLATYAGKSYHDYQQFFNSASDLTPTAYSNIENAFGLFGSFNTTRYPDFTLDRRSMDSLVYGICTRPQRWVDW